MPSVIDDFKKSNCEQSGIPLHVCGPIVEDFNSIGAMLANIRELTHIYITFLRFWIGTIDPDW